MLKNLTLKNFTVFEEIDIPFVPGVNIFIGQNGTGKTHLLKFVYSILACIQEDRGLDEKLKRVFLPKGLNLNRLVTKGEESANFNLNIKYDTILKGAIPKKGKKSIITSGFKNDKVRDLFSRAEIAKPIYIPVKEMLANAPGFRSLYATREIHFEEIYFDIVDRALLPELKQSAMENFAHEPEKLNKIIREIQKIIGGKVFQKNEEFYLRTGKGEIEFSMLAEGHRKLALLWLLIKNGSLSSRSVLFWDEPETNLNPSMIPVVVKTLLMLEQMGVQICVATHNYELLREFDLQKKEHSLIFNALHFRNNKLCNTQSQNYAGIDPNIIEDQFARLYNLEIERSFGNRNG